ncbi:MAG: hypothetical protein K2G55_04065, partial [Lachnospiraceae bacterium]|nr:hypothetical protein [Lachnospiraceae bacterium]
MRRHSEELKGLIVPVSRFKVQAEMEIEMRQEEMKLEDLKQNFPEMPSELRMLVERKVQEQIRIVPTKRRRRHMTRKTIAAAIAAVMLLGTTAFAGIAYKMHSEPVG